MKNITSAANKAGINHIECPNCKRRFNTEELFRRLFDAILELVRDGESVNVPKFGMFRSTKTKGRNYTSPKVNGRPGVTSWISRRVMKWRQSTHTKRFMNPKNTEQERERTVKRAKTVAKLARIHVAAIQEQKDRVQEAEKLRRRKRKVTAEKRKRDRLRRLKGED